MEIFARANRCGLFFGHTHSWEESGADERGIISLICRRSPMCHGRKTQRWVHGDATKTRRAPEIECLDRSQKDHGQMWT